MSLFDIRDMQEDTPDQLTTGSVEQYFITDFTEIVPTVFSRNKTLIECMPAFGVMANGTYMSCSSIS
jgi:hypothetical protein